MVIDRPNNYNTIYNIDKIHHPDSERVKVFGNYVSLGEVRKVYDLINNNNETGVILMYDDIFQFTSLGLLDLVFELKHIPTDTIPIKEFFNRPGLGIEFVYKICNLWGIKKEEVDEIDKKYYSEVLSRSPISSNAEGFINLKRDIDRYKIIFRQEYNGSADFIKNFRNNSIFNKPIITTLGFLNGKTEKEYLDSINNVELSMFNTIIVNDMIGTIDVIRKKKIDNFFRIFSYFNHNKLSEELIKELYLQEHEACFENFYMDFLKEEISNAS